MMKRKPFREEEYLEAILILEERHGKARVKELSEMLGVKPPSVVEYLEKLVRKGLVDYVKGRGEIKLTEEGRKIAEQVYKKHILLRKFLELIGVPKEVAEEDACKIEHVVSQTTLNRIIALIEFLETCPLTQELRKGRTPKCRQKDLKNLTTLKEDDETLLEVDERTHYHDHFLSYLHHRKPTPNRGVPLEKP